MSDYIPPADDVFNTWISTYDTYLQAHAMEVGVGVDELAALAAAKATWDAAFPAHEAARAAAEGARTLKDAAREGLEAVVRPMVARIQVYPDTTDDNRRGLGITVRGSAPPTPSVETSGDKPVPVIDMGSRLRHVIRFQNQTETGITRGKPAGAYGCEIWRKVGEAPAGPDDCVYVDTARRGPYIVEYSQADAGKTVHYIMRWVGTKGEKGSWSETESATIAA